MAVAGVPLVEFVTFQNVLSFDYDLEKVIDDWVLLGFLVGNDFIPHLPDLHIAQDALPLLYKLYCQVLPTLDGKFFGKVAMKSNSETSD